MKTEAFEPNTLIRHLPQAVYVLFVIQPVMDVISYFTAKLGVSNAPTLALRLLVLAATVSVGFAVSKRRTIYYTAAAVALIIGAGHVFASLQFGYADPFGDLTNYVRVLLMPFTAIALISAMKANKAAYEALKKAMVTVLFIIIAVELAASVSGTEPHTYADGEGFIGWFANTNSQSAILTAAAPVAVLYVYEKKGWRSLHFIATLILACLALSLFGTRLCYAGMAAMTLGLAASIIIIRPKNCLRALSFIFAAVLFTCAIPLSPMVRHQTKYNDFQSERQENVDNILSRPPASDTSQESAPAEPDSGTDTAPTKKELIERLTPIYEFYAADFVAIFGIEETIEMFDYTSDIYKITATRPKKLIFAQLLMENSPPSSLFFGIELSRFTVDDAIYDVENDLHGIYYLYGAVGLAAMLAFIGYFIYLIGEALVRDRRRYFTLDAAAWGISLVMCLGHVYCTAGVLRRPGASVYLAAILAAVYFLTRIADKEETEAVR